MIDGQFSCIGVFHCEFIFVPRLYVEVLCFGLDLVSATFPCVGSDFKLVTILLPQRAQLYDIRGVSHLFKINTTNTHLKYNSGHSRIETVKCT